MIVVAVFLLSAFLPYLGHCKPVGGNPLQYEVGHVYNYVYTTEILINEASSAKITQAQKDVGFKFSANIELAPVWAGDGEMVVKLAINKPKLNSAARSNLVKDLKGLPRKPIFFQWKKGQVGNVYASVDGDSTLAINFKKGIISMFQLRLKDGIHKETDSSGECHVSYTVQNDIVKRVKNGCNSTDTTGLLYTVNPLTAVSKDAKSQTTYSLADGLIHSALAVSEYTLRLNLEQTVSTRINMKQELKMVNTSKRGKKIQAAFLEEAIKKLGQTERLELYGMVLETTFEPTPCLADSLALKDKVSQQRQHLMPEVMAKGEGGLPFLQLIDAFRAASKESILSVLTDEQNEEIVFILIEVAVAAKTTACQEALMEYLTFDDYHKISKPERFLMAVAFTTLPNGGLLDDLLKLYRKEIPNENLQESVGEAMGAVLYTYCRVGNQCQSKVAKEVIRTLMETLETCDKEGCKLKVIRALSNAGIPDTIPTLLKYAVNNTDSRINEAAVMALRRMGKQNMNEQVKIALRQIFYQNKRGYDTAVRSQALKILLENSPSQQDIKDIMMQSLDPYNTEYDLYIQQTLFNLMGRDDKIKAMMEKVLKEPEFTNWNILAPGGKALAFTNNMAVTSSLTSTYFMYVENSKSGIMKRSGMDVDALSPIHKMPVYNFGMYAAGMEGLLGKEVEEGQQDVSATAGMSLVLMDVSLRPITFFTGQTGLMSAVWNAPSDPISALQTAILLTDHHERIHLQNGLIVETDLKTDLLLDLSGSLSVSLWNKNSKSLVINSVSITIQSSSAIITPSFRTGVELNTKFASQLEFQTDVDFYDGIKMCLQMRRPDIVISQNVTKFEHARGFRKGYVSKTSRTKNINALSYPLPRSNNKQCQALLSS